MSKLTKSVNNVKNGRYTLGGISEVSNYALEWWDRNLIKSHPSDIIYYVEKKYENKPHLLGFVFYADSNMWWVICQTNGIIDPLSELYEGKMLRIPTLERVKAEIITPGIKAGGIPSTR